LLLLLLGGLVYAFIRPGSKVRPDKSHDPGTQRTGVNTVATAPIQAGIEETAT
jgi:hypothetical protein